MIKLSQVHPVTDFVRNYKSYLDRIKQTKSPEVLTINGKPECVIMDPEMYQRMSDAFEEAQFVKAVNEGIVSMNQGKGKPTAEAFREIRSKVDL